MAESKPKSDFGRVGRMLGAIGIVLLGSAVLTVLLMGGVSPMVWMKVILGIILVAFYIATNPDLFARVKGSRTSGIMSLTLATVALVIGAVGALNYVVYQAGEEIDLTREGVHTLSPQTRELMSGLETEVAALAFYASFEPPYEGAVADLQRYANLSERFTYEVIDPGARPDLTERFQIVEGGPRVVVVAGDQEVRAKGTGEEDLTNALIKATQLTAGTVYFLTGHGERKTGDREAGESYHSAAAGIRAEGYEVDSLILARPDLRVGESGAGDALEVPEIVRVLVVADPQGDLHEAELGALERFLGRGGRLIVMLEPGEDRGLASLVRPWKISVRDDIIADAVGQLFGLSWAGAVLAPADEPHTITRGLDNSVVALTARSLAIEAGGEPAVTAQSLLETSGSAWGETHLTDDGPQYDDKDHPAPLVVAAAARKRTAGGHDDHGDAHHDDGADDGAGRLVVFGDADFISNRLWHQQGNADVFLNAVNWAAAREDRITIRPNRRASDQLTLSIEQIGYLKFFSMDILPVLLVALGLATVLMRRQR